MQFRDHPGVQGKRDAYPFDPRLLKIDAGYNVRDLDAADEREDLEELKESIRANGVRVPLEVRPVDEDVFVTAGHRRHKVVMELIAEGEPIKSVPVIPEPKNTTAEDRIINLVVSNSGKPLKPLEIAEVVRRLSVYGFDHGQIAKRLGWKSTASVTKHLDLIKLPEGIKQEVRDGTVSAGAADKFLKSLPKGTDPETARQILREAAEEKRQLTGNRRATPKALNRAVERTKPKPAELTAEEKAARASALGEAKAREANEAGPSMAELQEKIAAITSAPAPLTLKPPVELVPTSPGLKHLVSQEIQRLLGELAVVATDNELGERDPEELIGVRVELLARADRLYRQIIGEIAA